MTRPRRSDATLRAFWPELPSAGRWLLGTVVLQTIGRGLTLPFTVIYLHEIRGIPLDVAGALMAGLAVVALAVTGPGGALTDRIGGRPVLLAGSVAQLVGCVLLAYATTPLAAGIAFLLLGVNVGISWPALNALIAHIVDGPTRQQYFGINFALVNLGIGAGGVIGGLYVDVHNPATFTTIYLADGLTMLIPVALLLGPLRQVRDRGDVTGDEDGAPGTYLRILRRPVVAGMTLLTFLATFVGYGQMEAGFPAYAREVSEVSTRVVGFAFAVNTAVIVGTQFLVLRGIAGKRRTRALALMAAIWAVSWSLLALTGLTPGTLAAVAGVLAFHGLFAFGETFLQSTVPAITNDLAPDRLRGRYNAITAGAFQSGSIVGPVVAGTMLHQSWSGAFMTMLIAGCVGIGALAFMVERLMPAGVNGVGDEDPAGDPDADESVTATAN